MLSDKNKRPKYLYIHFSHKFSFLVVLPNIFCQILKLRCPNHFQVLTNIVIYHRYFFLYDWFCTRLVYNQPSISHCFTESNWVQIFIRKDSLRNLIQQINFSCNETFTQGHRNCGFEKTIIHKILKNIGMLQEFELHYWHATIYLPLAF